MKTIILAGGFGTRLSEETELRPKPMVEIGGRPILWHIMKTYAHYGFNDFSVALGYKGDMIKRFFLDYRLLTSSLSISLGDEKVDWHMGPEENWNVDLIDTGAETMTGGRLKRLMPTIENETVMMTYGDGVANIDIKKLAEFHRSHGKLATVTAVRPPARFGSLSFDGDIVTGFTEKPQLGEGWINGGYFVFESEVANYIEGDETYLEREPLERLAQDGQLMAYKHSDYWQPMDTLRDLQSLRKRWDNQDAPWKVWK
ncbi:MAG TPA: glucose-1-phosphate cytidylyltransferase [Dehalococcoidia bacterium]|jgi:glucose-1-phosphate cytidylyltransferase|nr:glucose-1-phosphate cytidylyltransferase [Dehalococcoidia bacterium]